MLRRHSSAPAASKELAFCGWCCLRAGAPGAPTRSSPSARLRFKSSTWGDAVATTGDMAAASGPTTRAAVEVRVQPACATLPPGDASIRHNAGPLRWRRGLQAAMRAAVVYCGAPYSSILPFTCGHMPPTLRAQQCRTVACSSSQPPQPALEGPQPLQARQALSPPHSQPAPLMQQVFHPQAQQLTSRYAPAPGAGGRAVR